MQSSPASTRTVRKRLADGTVKEYQYSRDRKPRRSKYDPNTLGALIIAYQRSPEWLVEKKPPTHQNYSIYLRCLDSLLHYRVKDIKRKHLLDLRNAIAKARGSGAASVFVRVVSALFTWAVHAQWLDNSPATKLKGLPGQHLPAWSEEQADAAEAQLPEYLRRVVVLGRYIGQRRSDLIKLNWSDYDGSVIRLTQTKHKKGRPPVKLTIPVHPTLKAELDEWKRNATSVKILTDRRGLPWTGTGLSHAMGRALKKLGMSLNVHGLRKLAATSLAEAGCSSHEIAAITGHQTLAMVELYTKSVNQEKLATAAISRLQTTPRKLPETAS